MEYVYTPILLIELWDRRPGNKPWLGTLGLKIVTGVFVGAAILTALVQYDEFKFMASPAQLGITTLVIVLLCIAAFRVRFKSSLISGKLPTPKRVTVRTFLALSAYQVIWIFTAGVEGNSDWFGVVLWFAWVIAIGTVCWRWCRNKGWDDFHRLALVKGALYTYIWFGFFQSAFLYGLNPIIIAGNVIFSAGAVVLLISTTKKLEVGNVSLA